ncbi:MAG: hypothetical protein AAGD25_08080 [Cyanobacteria bacterium P01_F01_bin.150]
MTLFQDFHILYPATQHYIWHGVQTGLFYRCILLKSSLNNSLTLNNSLIRLETTPVPYISVWLIPTETDRAFLQSLISQIAQQYQSVAFCPHVTLFSVPVTKINQNLVSSPLSSPWDLSEIDWDEHLSIVLSKFSPFFLKTIHIGWGRTFAKTVFVQLETTSTLLAFIQAMRNSITQGPATQAIEQIIDPHISLIYKHLDNKRKVAIAQSTTLHQHTFGFSEFQIVKAPSQFETQEDVQALRCIYRQTLNNGP